MEEEVGFEPTVRSSRTTVFKTAPINRSGTPPGDFLFGCNTIFIIRMFKCKECDSRSEAVSVCG